MWTRPGARWTSGVRTARVGVLESGRDARGEQRETAQDGVWAGGRGGADRGLVGRGRATPNSEAAARKNVEPGLRGGAEPFLDGAALLRQRPA